MKMPHETPEVPQDEMNLSVTEETRTALQIVVPEVVHAPRPFIADEDGCFVDGEERWIHLAAAADSADIQPATLRERLRSGGYPFRYGRNSTGRVARFYRVQDVVELAPPLPRSGADGFFLQGDVRYGTVGTWARELDLTAAVLKLKISKAGFPSMNVRDVMGRMLPFFAEADVREAARDLLKVLPRADASGFFTIDDERYGTVKAWRRTFGIAGHVIGRRLEKNGIRGKEGRDAKGKPWTFFSEQDVRQVCADLLADLPAAEPDGFFLRDNIRYGTIAAWARELDVSSPTVSSRTADAHCPTVTGRDPARKVVSFYAEADIRRLCADLIAADPLADAEGFFALEDVQHGTVFAWSKRFGVGSNAIRTRLEERATPAQTGLDTGGNRQPYFAEPDVRSACADLLENIPAADKTGFFTESGCRFGMVRPWARELGLSTLAIQRHLDAIDAVFRPGYFRGRRETFYAEADVRRACGELLEDLPKSDPDGFMVREGTRFGSAYAWSKVLGISNQTITKKVRAAGIAPLRVKNPIGVVSDFYPETVVRAMLEHSPGARVSRAMDVRESRTRLREHIAGIAKTHKRWTPYVLPESGFIRIEGMFLGTKEEWIRCMRAFELPTSIDKRGGWNVLPRAKGRLRTGLIVDLFNEADIFGDVDSQV